MGHTPAPSTWGLRGRHPVHPAGVWDWREAHSGLRGKTAACGQLWKGGRAWGGGDGVYLGSGFTRVPRVDGQGRVSSLETRGLGCSDLRPQTHSPPRGRVEMGAHRHPQPTQPSRRLDPGNREHGPPALAVQSTPRPGLPDRGPHLTDERQASNL